MTPSKRMGLRQQLATAPNLETITLLLREGALYPDASPATQRAWQRTADRRRAELTQPKK